MKRTPWQRLTLSILGILILLAVWRWSVAHLYTLPDVALSSFTTITTNITYAVCAIVVFMVTGRLVYEWSNRTESTQSTTSEIEHIKEEYVDRTPRPRDYTLPDDGTEEGT